jgi:P pilus assembly chaperone PapD
MKRTLAALTLLLAVLGTFQSVQAGISIEGQVVNVVQDEEGANVMMQLGSGAFKSIYIPRSNSNTGVTEKAFDALRTKRNFRLSL